MGLIMVPFLRYMHVLTGITLNSEYIIMIA